MKRKGKITREEFERTTGEPGQQLLEWGFKIVPCVNCLNPICVGWKFDFDWRDPEARDKLFKGRVMKITDVHQPNGCELN